MVGVTQDVDINYHLRVICYKKILKYYEGNVILSLLPLAMRMAGPREALLHAIIRKNYGATHFIIGREHASPSYKKENGEDFYGPYEAQDLLEKYSDEIKIIPIRSKMISYVKELDEYLPVDKIKNEQLTVLNLSGTKQRELLNKGEELPNWFSFPEIIAELKKAIKPKNERGFCLYFLGIPSSGKSTFANYCITMLKELITNRNITLLDGDVIRLNLSKGLGFSLEDRKINIERIGFVANEIVKHNGICVVANIAPYEESRKNNRELIEKSGDYIEIFVKTSLEECMKRDPKNLYEKARRGEIKNLTGYNDTFEEPKHSDIVIDGENQQISQELKKIKEELSKRNLI